MVVKKEMKQILFGVKQFGKHDIKKSKIKACQEFNKLTLQCYFDIKMNKLIN